MIRIRTVTLPASQQATGATRTLSISILSRFASSKRWGEMSYSPWDSSEANEKIWSRGRNRKPKREWENLLLDIFAKRPNAQCQSYLFPLCAKAPWSDRPGRPEPRRSFLSVLSVLKYLPDLFWTSWSWKTLSSVKNSPMISVSVISLSAKLWLAWRSPNTWDKGIVGSRAPGPPELLGKGFPCENSNADGCN